MTRIIKDSHKTILNDDNVVEYYIKIMEMKFSKGVLFIKEKKEKLSISGGNWSKTFLSSICNVS